MLNLRYDDLNYYLFNKLKLHKIHNQYSLYFCARTNSLCNITWKAMRTKNNIKFEKHTPSTEQEAQSIH